MEKKKAIIIIVALNVLVVSAFSIMGIIKYNKTDSECENSKEDLYAVQNIAFFGVWFDEYKAYDKQYEIRMQANMNLYTKRTGKIITAGDIEAFLQNKENPDGTPRTWEDDEKGVIKDYVAWCGGYTETLTAYWKDLQFLLDQYNIRHPDCPYSLLSQLTPEHINEISKKYDDRNYGLVLE